MSATEIKLIDGKGKGLVATTGIKKGAVVLIDQPYEAALHEDEEDRRSFYTFESHDPEKLMRCAGCKFARYSTKAEQAADWKQGHKEECKALKRRAPDYPGPAARLIARILWKSLREKSKQAEPQEGSKRATFDDVLSLMTHWDSMGAVFQSNFTNMATVIRMFMDPKGELTSYLETKLITGLFARLHLYGFTITDEEEKCIGIGMYTYGGLANHDCRPNAAQTYIGKTMYMRALRNIRAGEEILVSYVPCAASRPARRKDLIERYHFDIFSQKETENLVKLGPQARKYIPFRNMTIECNVWQTTPWEFDEHDIRLVELVKKGAGSTRLPGCGLIAQHITKEWEDQYLRDVEDTYGVPSLDAQNYRDPKWRETLLNPASRSPGDAAKSKLTPRRPSDAVVDVWGDAFLAGDDPKWLTVVQLTKHAAACLALVRECTMEDAGKPSMTSGEWWRLCKDADDMERSIERSSDPIVLGPLHILRNDYIEAKYTTARKSARWEPAFAFGTELRPFLSFMQPLSPLGLMLMDSSLARFCLFLERHKDASTYAGSALKQMQLWSPASPQVHQMKCIVEMSGISMRKSNIA